MTLIDRQLPTVKQPAGMVSTSLGLLAVIAQLAIPFLHGLQVEGDLSARFAGTARLAANAFVSGRVLHGESQRTPHHADHDSRTCPVCQAVQHARYPLTPAGIVAATVANDRESRLPAPSAVARQSHVEPACAPRAPPVLA
jgi:hypothetical protein